ncbi:MAG TPA: DinB family protein [Streptosporangiaceae bacterium]
MADQVRSPAEYAAEIGAARDRLIGFVHGCTDEQWRSAPLAGDPRPVAVVIDHVADAYEYLAGWLRDLVAGKTVVVDGDIVDALNAEHAQAAATVSRTQAAGHLARSGVAMSELVAGLSEADLAAGDGQAERFAQIAIRHADNHRTDIEAALAARGDSPAAGG